VICCIPVASQSGPIAAIYTLVLDAILNPLAKPVRTLAKPAHAFLFMASRFTGQLHHASSFGSASTNSEHPRPGRRVHTSQSAPPGDHRVARADLPARLPVAGGILAVHQGYGSTKTMLGEEIIIIFARFLYFLWVQKNNSCPTPL